MIQVEQFMAEHGSAIERSYRIILGPALGTFASVFVATWRLGFALVAALVVGFLFVPFYNARLRRTQIRIVHKRLCLDCGYSLLFVQLDWAGRGKCPECGRRFSHTDYDRLQRSL